MERPQRVRHERTPRDHIERLKTSLESFLEHNVTIIAAWERFREEVTKPSVNKTATGLVFIGMFVNAFPEQLQLGARYLLYKEPDFSVTAIDPQQYNVDEPTTVPKIGTGYNTEAYLLEARDKDLPQLVLKSHFFASTKSEAYLHQLLEQYTADYEDLCAAYNSSLPNLIPDTRYFVAKSPRTKKPALNILQTYAGNESFDLFNKDNYGRIIELLQTDSHFRKEFEEFRKITLQLQNENRAPDVAGGNNVLVVQQEDGEHSLRLVDTHRFSTEAKSAHESQERNLLYLSSITV